MARSFRSYIIISIIMMLAATSAFSQAPEATKPEPAQSKEIAIYGEVQSVNAAANTVSVQYYDYDSDSEKIAEIAVGKDAKMENAKAVSDIKKGDWVDVTYTVVDGHNMASMVSVEKEEPAAGLPAEE